MFRGSDLVSIAPFAVWQCATLARKCPQAQAGRQPKRSSQCIRGYFLRTRYLTRAKRRINQLSVPTCLRETTQLTRQQRSHTHTHRWQRKVATTTATTAARYTQTHTPSTATKLNHVDQARRYYVAAGNAKCAPIILDKFNQAHRSLWHSYKERERHLFYEHLARVFFESVRSRQDRVSISTRGRAGDSTVRVGGVPFRPRSI